MDVFLCPGSGAVCFGSLKLILTEWSGLEVTRCLVDSPEGPPFNLPTVVPHAVPLPPPSKGH